MSGVLDLADDVFGPLTELVLVPQALDRHLHVAVVGIRIGDGMDLNFLQDFNELVDALKKRSI